MIPRIVITGAPGSGKTVCLQHLKSNNALGEFLFFDELARRLLMDNPQLRHDRTEFHRQIYQLQAAREAAAAGRPFISDRGTVDAYAFHPETLTDVGSTLEREYQRYSSVIHLGSAARLGETYYQIDDVRNESIADALIIEEAIRKAWRGHPGYTFIDACPDLADKVNRCEEQILEFVTAG